MLHHIPANFFFFFNDTATTEIYTLSLHDALPISFPQATPSRLYDPQSIRENRRNPRDTKRRSEEHTSELQSQSNLVCRLLLEKKKKTTPPNPLDPSPMRSHSLQLRR